LTTSVLCFKIAMVAVDRRRALMCRYINRKDQGIGTDRHVDSRTKGGQRLMGTTGGAIFGVQLKRFRRAAGLTQEELAARAGYSAVYVSMIERGQRIPHPSTVELLADALDVSPHDRALLRNAARRDGAVSTADRAGKVSPQLLVGRAHELSAIEQHLVGMASPMLVLAGEPGIGKSRLLQEAARHGASLGWQVLRGGCQRRGGQEPYAPLPGTLGRYAREQEPTRLSAALQGCAWLARLLPELADLLEPLPAWAIPPEQERRLVVDAVIRFLGAIAGPAGTLLVLDDLQWASPDALDLLTALAHAAPAVPIRVVGAYRDTDVRPGDPLADTLADLAHAGLVTRLAPAPLADRDAARLFDHLVTDAPPALRARLLARAEGVPFYLVSCAQAVCAGAISTDMGDTGDADDAVALATPPWDVAQSVRQRVAALPTEARALLDVAAVVGRQASRALLAAATGCSDEELFAALDESDRVRLLEETGQDYRFVHDVIREVVEADLGAGRRAALHRRVATILAEQWRALGLSEEPLEPLAYHYAHGGSEEKAAWYLEQSGDRARARAAHAAAERYYRNAADKLERLEQPPDTARVREKLGALLATLARFGEALPLLEAAAVAYRARGDQDALGRTIARIGDAYGDSGTPEEGLRRLQPLAEILDEAGPSQGLAALHASLAGLFFCSGRYAESLAAATRVAALATLVDDRRLMLQAARKQATALTMLARPAEALPIFEQAVPLAESLDDPESLSRIFGNMAAISANVGALDRASLYLDRALAAAERVGDPVMLIHLESTSGFMAFYAGDWPRARADLGAALTRSRGIGMSSRYAYPLAYLSFLTLAEGAWDEAARLAQESIDAATPMGDLQVLRYTHALRAWCDILHGQPASARDRLATFVDASGKEGKAASWVLLILALAHLEVGDTDQAADVAREATTRARHDRAHLVLADALWARALVETRRGLWLEAERTLHEGLALARPMPYPFAEARLLHAYGVLHHEKGEPRQARACLDEALTIFRRLGARAEAARAQRALDEVDTAWMRRPDLHVSDAQWSVVAALLPLGAHTGRRRVNDRRTLEAILHMRGAGRAWSALPPDFGDDATAHRRLAEWRASGLWPRIEAIMRVDVADDS